MMRKDRKGKYPRKGDEVGERRREPTSKGNVREREKRWNASKCW